MTHYKPKKTITPKGQASRPGPVSNQRASNQRAGPPKPIRPTRPSKNVKDVNALGTPQTPRTSSSKKETSWQGVSDWYQKSVGRDGHYYHQTVVLPAVLRLLEEEGKWPEGFLTWDVGRVC